MGTGREGGHQEGEAVFPSEGAQLEAGPRGVSTSPAPLRLPARPACCQAWESGSLEHPSARSWAWGVQTGIRLGPASLWWGPFRPQRQQEALLGSPHHRAGRALLPAGWPCSCCGDTRRRGGGPPSQSQTGGPTHPPQGLRRWALGSPIQILAREVPPFTYSTY